MKFYKFISVILHPIVIPTLGVLLFLSISPALILPQRQYLLLSIIFFFTYVVPLISLIIFKALGVIKSYHVKTIEERKLPMFLILVIFYSLGKFLIESTLFRELGILFYGTILALLLCYGLFFFKIKTSLHVLSISSATGFFMIYGASNQIQMIPVISVLMIFTGILATARLELKAHRPSEIYIGFFLGILSQCISYYAYSI